MTLAAFGRIKLEQAETIAKMAEKSKATAEKKLKATEQDFLTSDTVCLFVFHFESRIQSKPETFMLGFLQKSVLFRVTTYFPPTANGG